MKKLISLLLCLALIVPCAFAEELPRFVGEDDADYAWLYEHTLTIAERFQKGLNSTWHSFLLSAANVPEEEMLEALSPLRLQDYVQPQGVTIVRADQILPNELMAEWSAMMAALQAEKEAKAAEEEEARKARWAEEDAAKKAAEEAARAAEEAALAAEEGLDETAETEETLTNVEPSAEDDADVPAEPDGPDEPDDFDETADLDGAIEPDEFDDFDDWTAFDDMDGLDEFDDWDDLDIFAETADAENDYSLDEWDPDNWGMDWEIDWGAELGWDVDFSVLDETDEKAPSPYAIKDDPARDLYHAASAILNFQGDAMFEAISYANRVTGIYACPVELEAPCYAVIDYGGPYALLITYYPVLDVEGYVSVNAQVILSQDASELLMPAE